MKKFTFLLMCLFPISGTINAQENGSATVEELLERSANAGNPLGLEPADLFTSEEKLLLQEHFNTNDSDISLRDVVDGDVFAYQLYGGCDDRGLGSFPLAGPFNIDYVSYSTTKFFAGDQDDAGNLYGVRSDQNDENGFLIFNIGINLIKDSVKSKNIIAYFGKDFHFQIHPKVNGTNFLLIGKKVMA